MKKIPGGVIYAVLMGLVVLAAEFLDKLFNPVTIHGHEYGWVIIMIPFIFPLRDITQERQHRLYAIAGMTLAAVVYFFTTKASNAEYAAIALVWAELIDYGLYTTFRKYGAVPAVVVSDLIATPSILFILFWLLGYPRQLVPWWLIQGQYVILVGIWSVIFLTPLRNLFDGLPMFSLSGGKRKGE